MASQSTEPTVEAFLSEAAATGYLYPEGESYTICQDHASWLDGALRLIAEEFQPMEQLPLYKIGEHRVNVEGWDDVERAHIFRATHDLSDRSLRWPELVLSAMDGREICIHAYKMSSVRSGRLASPLVMAYQHPSFQNINYRLAKLDGDKDFKKSWKRIGRWEIQPNPLWEEWRRGIEKDRCIDAIRETYTVSPTLDTEQRDRLLFDVEQMCSAQEKPSIFPRYRERCGSCVMNGLCHGDEYSRSLYTPVNQAELERYKNRLEKL